MLRRFAALSSMTATPVSAAQTAATAFSSADCPGFCAAGRGVFPAARSKPSVNTFSYSAVLERKKRNLRAHFFQNADYFQRLLDLRGQLFQHLAVRSLPGAGDGFCT